MGWCPPRSTRRRLGYEERRMRRQETEHPRPPTMQCPVGREGECQGTACEDIVINFSQRLFYLTHWSVLEDRFQGIACEVITVSQDDDIIKCDPLRCQLMCFEMRGSTCLEISSSGAHIFQVVQ